MNKKGFTVIELMVVVFIIGTILALTIPCILRARVNAENAKIETELRTIYTAVVMYQCDKNENPKSWDDLETYLKVSRFEDSYEINQGI